MKNPNTFFLRIIWNKKTRSAVLWLLRFFPLRKGQVVCASWGGAKYNCNPRAIAEEISRQGLKSLTVYFAFEEPAKFEKELANGVNAIKIGSLKYYYILATSQFIIFNIRMSGLFFPYKKKGQYYIQTQHGGHGIKKVEFDAELPDSYLKVAEEDTKRTDLMLSDSKYWTNIYRTSYRYKGEILEVGLPRNDVFFRDAQLNKEEGKKYVIYTPTFRSNGRRDVYGFDYDKVIAALENRFGGEWYIRISSHPNMQAYYKEIYDFSHPRLIDIGGEDLQPYLLSSDILITDYSSAEMDFSLTKRPIFQLCKDRRDYDRGFYVNPEDLPFPYAETDEQLLENIVNFDNEKYKRELEAFNKDVIGLNETGHASEAVVEWMLNKLKS